jgi:ADP-heptose:LPS heptosyltransferase
MTFIHAVENCEESVKMNFFEVFQKMSGIEYDINEYQSKLIPIKNITMSVRKFIKPNTVVIHMNSSTRLRHVPATLWVEIFKKLIDLGYNIGLLDNPNNSEKINSFIASSPFPKDRIYNLAPLSRDVNYAVAICDLCVAGICVDSAIGHMIAALNKPGVTLCGPYTPHNITRSYNTVIGIAPIDWNECNKYPCNYNAQEHLCPYLAGGQGVGCLKAITATQTINAFLKQLEICNGKQKIG